MFAFDLSKYRLMTGSDRQPAHIYIDFLFLDYPSIGRGYIRVYSCIGRRKEERDVIASECTVPVYTHTLRLHDLLNNDARYIKEYVHTYTMLYMYTKPSGNHNRSRSAGALFFPYTIAGRNPSFLGSTCLTQTVLGMGGARGGGWGGGGVGGGGGGGGVGWGYTLFRSHRQVHDEGEESSGQ
jgi:hypothetical protein